MAYFDRFACPTAIIALFYKTAWIKVQAASTHHFVATEAVKMFHLYCFDVKCTTFPAGRNEELGKIRFFKRSNNRVDLFY